jgi:hypothetical protein
MVLVGPTRPIVYSALPTKAVPHYFTHSIPGRPEAPDTMKMTNMGNHVISLSYPSLPFPVPDHEQR